jgi:hypothetical protein
LGFLDLEQKKWERKDWVKKPSIWCLELCWVFLGFEEEEEDSLVGGWVCKKFERKRKRYGSSFAR